jgi:hypothetical protein
VRKDAPSITPGQSFESYVTEAPSRMLLYAGAEWRTVI